MGLRLNNQRSSEVRIRIECEGAKNLPLESLIPTQDELKELTQENYAKLKNEILSEGFSFPFFVWEHDNKNQILDGHHRRLVLLKMQEEGYDIPELPCSIVNAKDEKEAARKLLAVTSQYAKITDQGLYEFMNKFDIDMAELKDRFQFSDIDFKKFEGDFFDHDAELPDLGDGSDPDIQQVTLTLSNEQKDIMDDAISRAKKDLDCSDEINENGNGNAMAAIMRLYVCS
jgi:ParB-like chromosome segregation protein Spo0J